MLIRYSVENFMSYKGREIFSTISGKGTLKKDHINSAVKGIKTLKTSLLFGANASGKSNIVKAISFGKKLILNGPKADNVISFPKFRLDKECEYLNSRMEYEIQHKGKNYAYGFVFNSKQIVEEWLYEFDKKKDIKIFERNIVNDSISFDLEPLFKINKETEEQQFLQFTANSTPSNRLFLTEIKDRRVKENVTNIEDILNVIDWFQNTLKIIFPSDKYKEGIKSELGDNTQMTKAFDSLLEYFGTGISGICLNRIKIDNINLPVELKDRIIQDLLEDKSDNIRAMLTKNNKTYFFSKKGTDIIAEKFMTKHKAKGYSSDVKFDAHEESDGTNRIIDYIPLILDLIQGDKVFIIDEIERSLHPNLSYELIDLFLDKSKKVNGQLIASTHESSLLTQKLIRKDEVWFTVKDDEGASHLYSLEDYNIRFDKQIRNDYLMGRFKAIPKIRDRENLILEN